MPTEHAHPSHDNATSDESAKEGSLLDLLLLMARHKRLLLATPVLVGALAFGGSYLITPKFTATGQILAPQQQQSTAAALLGSLGGLAGAGGAIAGLKNPADQWVALIKSRTVADAMLDRFKLVERYETDFRFQARNKLEARTKINAGKDGLIDIEVEDEDPQTAAAMVTAYVEELGKLSNGLAVTEAAQRRLFFERQLMQAKDSLIKAEIALQKSGVSESVLKTDPSAAVASIAQLKAQVTATEVQLQVMGGRMTAEAPEYRGIRQQLSSLKSQLAQAERADTHSSQGSGSGTGYVSLYREFKYNETLFDMMARQYELAKADEARQGAIIQVVDAAQVPEWKSSPKRATLAAVAAVVAFLAAMSFVLVRNAIANLSADAQRGPKWDTLTRGLRKTPRA